MNVIEIEQGSVVLGSENDTSLMTIVTLTFSSIGILLSGAAITLLFLTAFIFTEWRQNYKNQLLIQFMISRFLYTFVRYVFDIEHVFSICVNNGCVIYLDALAMIYTEAVLVTWMFIFTKNMYDNLVNVFVVDGRNIWRVSSLAWTVPGFLSLLCYTIFKKQDNNDFIYFFMYLVLLKWPLLIANAVMLILILKYVIKTNLSKIENNRRIVLVMILLILGFGFQQVFLDILKIIHVLLVQEYTVSSYILIASNIISFYHCAFSITFWVFGNEKTRKLWKLYRQKSVSTEIIETHE